MSKHRDFSTGDQLPAGWLDALNEVLGSQASPNLRISRVNSTTLKIAGAAGNGQVAVSLGGKWRFNSADITATAPANVAGTYPIYLTSQVNNDAQEDAGTFNYGFGMKLSTTPSGSGAEAISRQIGTYVWDGSSIVRWTDLNSDGMQQFLKPVSMSGSDRLVNFGTNFTPSFAGGQQTSGTISHGLGTTPTQILVSAGSIAVFSGANGDSAVACSWATPTSTTFIFIATIVSGLSSNATTINWMAVA